VKRWGLSGERADSDEARARLPRRSRIPVRRERVNAGLQPVHETVAKLHRRARSKALLLLPEGQTVPQAFKEPP